MDEKIKSTDNQRCNTYCTADAYQLPALAKKMIEAGNACTLTKEVLHIVDPSSSWDIFVFSYGALVCWNVGAQRESRFLHDLNSFVEQPLTEIEEDHFYYSISDQTTIKPHANDRFDFITLHADTPELKLAISYALSQSVKLESFEEAIQAAVKKNNALPEELAERGVITLSRRAIFKRMGEIFIARNSINLNIEYLDEPEFFWQNPGLEEHYLNVKNYLDIPARVESINQKLDVLQALLEMLNSQIEHSHSSLLEIIIILLIFVEIIMSLFQFHLV